MATKLTSWVGKGVLLALVFFIIFGPISSLIIWSIAISWYWPHPLPQQVGLNYWKQALGLEKDWAITAVGIWEAFKNTIVVAVVATSVAMAMSIPAGYVLARLTVPLKPLLLLLFLMPKVFPQQPIFVNLLPAFTRIGLAGTLQGVIVVHILVCLTFGIWISTSAFKTIPNMLEEAARSVGASTWHVFRYVLLPLAKPGLLVATVFVFVTSITEFTGTFFIGLPFVTTMPMLLYSSSGYNMQFASVLAIVLLVMTMFFMALAQRIFRAEYLGVVDSARRR